MVRKNIIKNLNSGDEKPSSSQRTNEIDRDKDGNCQEKEFGNSFSNELQGYVHVQSSLKAMYKNRFEMINERIDNVLTTISSIDRKVDEMHEKMTSSMLVF